ncbi:MAG: trichohyalin-plectin-homology domain domain-containing protein [archaeon]|nr:trichohyalin-plectin-homology domain domain-containing protein [archaeon]
MNTTEENFKASSPHLNTVVGTQADKALNRKERIMEYDKNNKYMNLAEFDKDLAPSKAKQADLYMTCKDRQNDKMKEMSQLAMFAKVAHIRDKQLEERKFMEELYRRKNRKLDDMMEFERLKELKYQIGKEQYLKEQQRQGQMIIIEQIKESDVARLKRKDELEKEKRRMNKQIKAMLEEDQRIKEQKAQEILKKAKEIEDLNKKAQLIKERIKIEDKEEDLKILKYNIEKAKREEELLAEKKRIAEEKEKETQRLREKQERAKDKQAEMDAIKAKRAYEESERKARLKEEADRLRHEELQKAVTDENRRVQAIRERLQKEALQKEKDEYNKIVERQLLELEKEKEKERQMQLKRLANKTEVEKQIYDKGQKDVMKKYDIIDEGKRNQKYQDDYYQELERFRQAKLKELQGMNVDEKYYADLKKYNIYKDKIAA